jgi:hypothetical protein
MIDGCDSIFLDVKKGVDGLGLPFTKEPPRPRSVTPKKTRVTRLFSVMLLDEDLTVVNELLSPGEETHAKRIILSRAQQLVDNGKF